MKLLRDGAVKLFTGTLLILTKTFHENVYERREGKMGLAG